MAHEKYELGIKVTHRIGRSKLILPLPEIYVSSQPVTLTKGIPL